MSDPIPSFRLRSLACLDLDPALQRRILDLLDEGPDASAWRILLDRTLLYMAAALLASGTICFFAFNWAGLHRFGKFALVAGLLLGAMGAAWKLGLDRTSGRVALFLACILVGVWLAVFGQVYQTGADAFELFRAWALVVLPWVYRARFQPLWGFWFLLLNLWLGLWWEQAGPRQDEAVVAGSVALLNGVAWACWEVLAKEPSRWLPRLLALPTLGALMVPALEAVVERHPETHHYLGLGLLIAVGAALLPTYLRARRDLFMVTLILACAITLLTSALGRLLLEGAKSCAPLLALGLLLVLQVGAAAAWLRHLSRGTR